MSYFLTSLKELRSCDVYNYFLGNLFTGLLVAKPNFLPDFLLPLAMVYKKIVLHLFGSYCCV